MRFGKRAVALVGFSLTTIFMAAFILLPADSIGATYGLELVRALCVRADDSAHLGDVRRRRRLRGVEDRPPYDGRRLRDDSLRAEDGLSLGGAIGGLAAVGLRLSRRTRRRPSTRCWAFGSRSASIPAIFLCVVVVLSACSTESRARSTSRWRPSWPSAADAMRRCGGAGTVIGAEGSSCDRQMNSDA